MTYIVTKQLKSTGLAAFLAVLFGGIGLFYSTILGGVVMTIVFPVLVFGLFFASYFSASIVLACAYYVICIVWAVVSVSRYNRNILEKSLDLEYKGAINTSEVVKEYNYYDEYRRSQNSNEFFIWIVVTIILFGLMVCGILYLSPKY